MTVEIILGDNRQTLRALPAATFRTCITSPPYFGLRDYDHPDQIGMEEDPDAYVAELVAVFREVRRVLADDGTLWVNLGDTYASRPNGSIGKGSRLEGGYSAHDEYRRAHARRKSTLPAGLKHKDLIGIPWMVAFALRADGWYLRQEVIWSKPNPTPESVKDRCTKSHESLFLLSKSPTYYFDHEAIQEPAAYPPGGSHHDVPQGGFADKGEIPGTQARAFRAIREKRNKRSVWSVPTQPLKDAHFAAFPPRLIEPCILASTAPGDQVLDPFGGAGTTGLVADRHGRYATLLEVNPKYVAMAKARISADASLLAEVV
jgi:DNA modification methylase